MTQMRRLALKKNVRELGFPLIAFPGEGLDDPADEAVLAAQQIAKYGGFVVLDHFSASPGLCRCWCCAQNIYTDPQKPIQVQPGLYEINNPKPDSPLMVTTNFSITYFSVANEVESSGLPGWLLVADAEGMSVLTAWAAGKFDAATIAKGVKIDRHRRQDRPPPPDHSGPGGGAVGRTRRRTAGLGDPGRAARGGRPPGYLKVCASG